MDYQPLMTRVSHDLAGSLGALFNTVELLEADPSFLSDALPLLKETIFIVNKRLQFFRAAFGTNAPIPEELATNYLKTLSMPIHLEGKADTRFKLLLVMIAGDVLIRGGRIDLSEHALTATGKSIGWTADHQKVFNDCQTEAPRFIPIVLLQEEAKRNQWTISVSHTDTSFALSW